ncbi:helix-turn-helix transcriptional regulator [Endozoicomonas atrinae]|uniref:helix-turn-helix transcriptional regulator n=1 Tax=Endozoicomonas atrinae TaxID=1333660 RepID=UPI003B001FBD
MITVKGKKYELDCLQVTPRQAEFIILLAEGHSQRQIAAMNGVSYQAVTARLSVVKEKLQANNAVEIVAICFAEGWMRKIQEETHG